MRPQSRQPLFSTLRHRHTCSPENHRPRRPLDRQGSRARRLGCSGHSDLRRRCSHPSQVDRLVYSPALRRNLVVAAAHIHPGQTTVSRTDFLGWEAGRVSGRDLRCASGHRRARAVVGSLASPRLWVGDSPVVAVAGLAVGRSLGRRRIGVVGVVRSLGSALVLGNWGEDLGCSSRLRTS
jgi:hypothetical protein